MPTPQSLAENWLSVAESYGSTKWLKQFIRFYVLELETERLSPEAFANELEEEFASRGLDTPAQQKNYRSNVVQAIKVFDPEHPAIDLVALSTAQYRVLNDQQRERIADRETRFITSAAAEAIVERARTLISSAEWSEVGAGLAVLIGRRISEILISTFSLKSAWSLNFSQMAKRQETQDITIEIPTLAPAQEVLTAIQRLQQGLRTDDLRLQGLSERQAKQKVNNLYSGAIAQKCEDLFSDLVPARSDKENLYTHIFRAVYATIAAHWYCPPAVPEHQFKAEIQGHFTITQDGKKLPNYAARSNYDDYAIGNGQGNRDGRLGIKLGQVPDLAVVEVFQQPRSPRAEPATVKASVAVETAPQPAPEPPDNTSTELHSQEAPTMTETDAAKPMTKRPSVYADDLERMTDLMAHQGVTGSTADVIHALLQEFEAKTAQEARQEVKTASEFAQAINWFTQEIETLRQQYHALEQEHQKVASRPVDEEAVATLKERNAQLEERNAQLEERNAALETELEETRSQLNAIQDLLGGIRSGAARPTAERTTTTPTAKSTAKPAAESAEQPVTSPPETRPKPETVSRHSDRADSTDKIADVIDAIIKWNTAQERSDLRLRISFPSIRSLAVLVGASYLPAIKEVIAEKEAEIEEIHERFMIGSRHNRSVQDKDAVLQAIARDYLGIPNWQKATYVN
ncbi:protelomerase family protein [Halomicronema sp. CCY15110]|uniref:protelomerase family protein n=1 Tax=Halomicronema sp. CCY15110 TaxID=2767773 RepID=UPI00194E1ADC|nr:protelomerase family protein [Halomicronema sp. CCY15110]